MDSEIEAPERPDIRIHKLPILAKAQELRASQSANVVALGALHSVAKLFPKQAMREAVLNNVPAVTRDINEKAFQEGVNLGKLPSTKQPARKEDEPQEAENGDSKSKPPRAKNGKKNGNGATTRKTPPVED